jgi:spore coat polysaccharide biosynthesis protein SpsF
MSTKRVVAIVQARMGSTRLSGKVMKEVLGRPLLWYLVERLRAAKLLDDIVIATTELESDGLIVDFCEKFNIKFFRGSENDVLSRYAGAAKIFDVDCVVRICSDSPLIDPELIDELINEFLLSSPPCDYLSNTLDQTYPLGMNVEVFASEVLFEADSKAVLAYEREHVTPYIYCGSNKFSICKKHYSSDFSKVRLTVDVQEDFDLVKAILECLYPQKNNFNLKDILEFYQRAPEVFRKNSHIQQRRFDALT